ANYGNGIASDVVIASSAEFGKVLSMNAPDPPPAGADASVGIRTKSSYSTAAPYDILSVKSKVLLNAADGSGAGVVGFAQPDGVLNGYALAVIRTGTGPYNTILEIYEFNGDIQGTARANVTVAIDPTDLNNVHTYELRAAFNDTDSIDFQVHVDDSPAPVAGLTWTDASPWTFDSGVVFSLATNVGQHAYFDDFVAAEDVVPEPATVLLFGLGGLALLRKKR
ncbi:MAG: PEP-CTERM sorting domain-containing protein, partial [Planctomycetota bacterium]